MVTDDRSKNLSFCNPEGREKWGRGGEPPNYGANGFDMLAPSHLGGQSMGLMNQTEKQKFLDHLQSRYQGCPHCHVKGGGLGDVVGLPVMERGLPDGIAPGQQVQLAIP